MLRLETGQLWSMVRKTFLRPYLFYRWTSTSAKNPGNAALAGAEPFLSGSSSVYVEMMYDAWQKDPNSVHKVAIYIA